MVLYIKKTDKIWGLDSRTPEMITFMSTRIYELDCKGGPDAEDLAHLCRDYCVCFERTREQFYDDLRCFFNDRKLLISDPSYIPFYMALESLPLTFWITPFTLVLLTVLAFLLLRGIR